MKVKKAQLEEAEALSKERTADLGAKKAELEGIEAETAPLVAEYSVQADGVKEKIDERLLAAYERIRRNVRNGLAVVTVKRDACGGVSTTSRPSVRWTSARVRRSLSASTAAVFWWPIPKNRRNRDCSDGERLPVFREPFVRF